MAAIEAPNFKRGEVKAPKPKPVDLEAKVTPPSYRSFNHLSGVVSSGRLRYTDVYSFAWWRAGDKEAPVRLELSEDTGSLFTEVRIQADYLPSVKRDFGQELSLKAEGRPEETLYRAQVSRLESRELVSVGAETMISKLQAFEPETLRVKGPFTPRDALLQMIQFWQSNAPWLDLGRVTEFFITTAEGYLVPQLGALLCEQPTDVSANKTSAYGWLERFFKLFAAYRFRINQRGELTVVGPRIDKRKPLIFGSRTLGEGTPFELTGGTFKFYTVVWGAQAVRLFLDVSDSEGMRSRIEYRGEPLVKGEENRYTNPRGHPYTIVFRLSYGAFHIGIENAQAEKRYFVRGYVEVQESEPDAPVKRLEARDVGFDLSEVTDFEGVVNRCAVTSQGFGFVPEQELLEPSYVIYRDADPKLDDQYQEPSSEERKEVTSVWSAPENTIIGAGVLTLAINIELYSINGYLKGFGIDETLQVGESKRIYVERSGFGQLSYELTFYLRFTGSEVYLYGATWSGGRPNAWVVLLNAAGEKFARSNEKIFQLVDESLSSPYGVRREDIDSGPFPISNEVALAIAQNRVAEGKEPRTVLSFEQSPRLPLLPDDLHRTVELPDGRRGVVSSWSYSEAHTPQGSVSRSRVEVRLEKE